MPKKELMEEKEAAEETAVVEEDNSAAKKESIDEKELMEFKKETKLIDADTYLKAGAHIGTKEKTEYMRRYIYKQRKDGLKVMDIETIDNRIQQAANLLAQFDLNQIIIVSRKLYGRTAAKKFGELMGAKSITSRFVPGTFTNPTAREFTEGQIIIVTEPDSDFQAVKESVKMHYPVIAFASTNNTAKNVDLIIPINNKGRKSIALGYYLLARETMKAKGLILKNEDFKPTLLDFEHKIKEGSNPRMEMDRKPREAFKRPRRPFREF